MPFRLLCRLWASVLSLQQSFFLLSLKIDLLLGGSYKLKRHCHTFLASWLQLWGGLYLMCFTYVLALDISNWIKICLGSSSRILKSCPLLSLWLFVGDFDQVYVQCVKSAIRLYFAVLVCLSFSWDQHYYVLALNIVDSPISVFIPSVSGQFEQALPNLSSFDQSTVSSSLRKLVKPKKSERHSRNWPQTSGKRFHLKKKDMKIWITCNFFCCTEHPINQKSAFRVPECPSAWMPRCPPSASSTQVSSVLECPSALRVPWVPWVLECPWSAWVPQVPKCLSALSVRVLKCLSSARVPWVFQIFEWPSAFCTLRVEMPQ